MSWQKCSCMVVAGTALCVALCALAGCGRSWAEQRDRMVREQIEARGVKDPAVLSAMRSVPRHLFLPEDARGDAYLDAAASIGDGQSTPQPYIVALMAEQLELAAGARVLEIGTGSGYQAAVLAAMGAEVFTIELREGLCEKAARLLAELDYSSAHVRCGNGYGGWPEEAPFDAILVTVAPDHVPEPLFEQLREGGRMVIPIGPGPFYQDLKVVIRTAAGFDERSVIPVRFGVLE